MPTFLKPPAYGPGGPDGRGWTRLTLGAHFDHLPQCGWRPTHHTSLFEALTGRQHWGGYERCAGDGPEACAACPVQHRRLTYDSGLDWPADTPLLLARVRPWPSTPDALFADQASGRSTLELSAWRGGPPIATTGWKEVLNTPGVQISWRWQDEESEAFWIVRNHSESDATAVLSEHDGQRTRHELYSGRDGIRTAILTCDGACAHEAYHLQQLAADLDGLADGTAPSGEVTVIPESLPGVPLISITQDGAHGVLHLGRSRDYPASTVHINWESHEGELTATALVAHAVRLTAV